ncbi:MAG: hypothetical protein WCZ23_11545 [Rhodospirillaceae bacterium]
MDWDTSTEQGRRSLIAAFILTLLIVGPLVLLSDSGSDPALVELSESTAVSGSLAIAD